MAHSASPCRLIRAPWTSCLLAFLTPTVGSNAGRASRLSQRGFQSVAPFWGLRGFPDAFLDESLELYLHREHAAFTPWIAPGQRLTFDVAPERVILLAADGKTL